MIEITALLDKIKRDFYAKHTVKSALFTHSILDNIGFGQIKALFCCLSP